MGRRAARLKRPARQQCLNALTHRGVGFRCNSKRKGTLYVSQLKPFPSPITEVTYTTAQLAAMWQLSVDTIRSLFEREPGVMLLQRPRRGVRRYRTLRIPASVAERVFRRMTVPAA